MIKNLLPKSLLGRSLLIIVAPLILLQIITTFIFFDRHWQTMSKRLSGSLAGEIAIIIDTVKNQEQQEREEIFLLVEGKTGMKVKFLKNEIIKQKINKGMLERSLAKAIKERVGMPYYIDGDTYEELVEIQIQLEDGVISFLTNKKMLFSSTTYIFILWMFGSSLLLFAIATIFMRNQIRPIRRLAIAANNFGKGKNITNFSSGGAREVRLASAAFQNMKTRIQRQMKQRTEMLAGVSHDLNTILTRMKLEIELMKENDSDKNNLSSDIFEMKKMIDGYLSFARGEGSERTVVKNLDDFLRSIVSNLKKENVRISLETNTNLKISLRENNFKRCINNILNNSFRYAKNIDIRSKETAGGIEITIDDDGIGIPKESRDDVFKPFFRLDSSRNLDKGSVGLGLSIARDIINSHGGEIYLKDSNLGGLRVLISLPI